MSAITPALLTRRIVIAAGAGAVIAASGALAQEAMVAGPAPRDITHDPDQPVLGNPDGDVTLIEFYDYQCPFCRRDYPALLKLVKDDGNIRLVMKDLPILGEASDHAVQLGLGAAGLGQYAAAHQAMMATKGRGLKADKFDAALKSAGVDPVAALAAFEREADRWGGLVTRNMEQATMIGLQGTPSYIVGMNVFPGVTSIETLREAVAVVRKG